MCILMTSLTVLVPQDPRAMSQTSRTRFFLCHSSANSQVWVLVQSLVIIRVDTKFVYRSGFGWQQQVTIVLPWGFDLLQYLVKIYSAKYRMITEYILNRKYYLLPC